MSSWPLWGLKTLRAFAGQQRYNLIFAPHLRLFDSRPPARVASLAPFLGHPGIHMDLGGTSAAIDMTYARLADIYVGDVSSQVYEFLREPRPCLFLDPHATAWEGEESFRHWEMGPVATTLDDLAGQIDRARQTHPAYRLAQMAAFRQTFDLAGAPPSVRAADAIGGLFGPNAVRSPSAATVGADRAPSWEPHSGIPTKNSKASSVKLWWGGQDPYRPRRRASPREAPPAAPLQSCRDTASPAPHGVLDDDTDL